MAEKSDKKVHVLQESVSANGSAGLSKGRSNSNKPLFMEWLPAGLTVLCLPEQATSMSANLRMLLPETDRIYKL